MNWQLIETDEALQDVLALAQRSDAVIVDTEFMRRNTFFPKVALLQLCFDIEGEDAATGWLIDPLQISDPDGLITLLENRSIVKVLHSASEDLEVFQHWLSVLPQPLFDTQRAAALLDIGFGMGYSALVEALAGEVLPKGETRSDWLQRPLTQSQCDYAAQDVVWLLPVWRELRARAVEQDRFDWIIADGADAVSLAGAAADYYHRIKGAWQLDPQRLAVLAALCRWREDTARTRDKPRGWIIDDKACLAIAQACPDNSRALNAAVELPPAVQRRYTDTLLELVRVNRELPDESCPPPLPRPLAASQRDRLKKLKATGREIAAGLRVAPEVLLSSKDYELLVREAAGEVVAQPDYFSGWRAEPVLRPLRESLAGAGA